jgi:hypothetical protein
VMNSKLCFFLVSGKLELKIFGSSDGVTKHSSLKAASISRSVAFTISTKTHFLLCAGQLMYNKNY